MLPVTRHGYFAASQTRVAVDTKLRRRARIQDWRLDVCESDKKQ